MATDSQKKQLFTTGRLITIVVAVGPAAFFIHLEGIETKILSDYWQAGGWAVVAMAVTYLLLKFTPKLLHLLGDLIRRWLSSEVARIIEQAIKNSPEMRQMADVGFWRSQNENAYREELSFYTVLDEGQEHNNLLNKIIAAVNQVTSEAKEYELLLIKYGGSTLRVGTEYLKALELFADKGGDIHLFIPKVHVDIFINNPNQSSLQSYDAVVELKSHFSHSKPGKLFINSYDDQEFGFFHTLKVGVLIKKDGHKVNDTDATQHGFCFLSVRSADNLHAVSSVSHNPALVKFIAKGVKFFQKEKTQSVL